MRMNPTTDHPDANRVNILLVDDQPANLLALEAILEPLHQNLVRASSGDEALRRLLETDFAVILLDVQMRGLNGFETAQLIRSRERSRHTPIIFLTAYESPDFTAAQAYTLGAVDYLVKPLVPDILRAKVAVFVELAQKTERLRQMERAAFERRLADEALRQSETRFRTMADTAPVLLWESGPDGGRTFVNKPWLEFTGRTPEQELGDGWAEGVHPEDAPHCREIYQAAFRDRRSFQREYRLRRADGQYRQVFETGVPRFQPDGGFAGYIGSAIDITERKQAEEALRESEARHRQLADNLPAGFIYQIIQEPDGRVYFSYVSAGVEALLGVTPAEVVAGPTTLYDLVHEDDLPHLRASETEAFHRHQPFECRFRSRTRAGGLRWLHCRSAPRRLPGGGTVWDGIAVDITERVRIEEALRASEAQFRLLADTIPQLAWMAHPDGHIFWYNRRWYEYTGTTPAQMEGWGWQLVHDPEELPNVLERWKASIATGEPFDMVFPLKGADGHFRPFLTRINPLRDEAGRVLYWFGTNTDISEQKRAEDALRASEQSLQQQTQRLRLLWEAASILLTTTEPDAMLRGLFAKIAPHFGLDTYFNFMVNETGDALRLASCTGVSEETARSITRLEFGQAICGTVALRRQPIVATHIQESDDPKVQLVKSFGIRAYACNPLMAEGTLFGTLSFASHTRDEFDADELEFLRTLNYYVCVAYERLRLVKQLQDANRHKDEFLAMLAHELRNPLAPIRNSLHILHLAGLDRQTLEQVRTMMERQVRHLSRLVDDLLDVARITRGKIQIRRELVDLAGLVRTTAEDRRPTLKQAGMNLTVDVPKTPVWVAGDATRLVQVLGNLLDNAIKFKDHGDRVAVRLSVDDRRRQAVLVVRDNGAGIEPALLPRLFDPFAQADRTLDRSRGGLGLGLSLVKGLVQLHGGEVRAASAGTGQGAEFTVRLPLKEEVEALTGSPGAAAHRAGQPLRILIVEDNRDAADSLRMLLQLSGHEVTAAYTGPEGVEKARSWRPDVVLCDIGLPGLDGYGVATELRRDPSTAKVNLIALTGYGREEDRQRARQAGFNHHLTKPVDPNDLQSLLVRSA